MMFAVSIIIVALGLCYSTVSVWAPIPNRAERATQATLAGFFDEVSSVLRQCNLFLQRNILDHNDSHSSNHAVMRELESFRSHIEISVRHIQGIRRGNFHDQQDVPDQVLVGNHVGEELPVHISPHTLNQAENDLQVLLAKINSYIRHPGSSSNFVGADGGGGGDAAAVVTVGANIHDTTRPTTAQPSGSDSTGTSGSGTVGTLSICQRIPPGQNTKGASSFDLSKQHLQSLLDFGFSVSCITKNNLLGIKSRNTIYKYMKKHNIASRRERYSNISNDDLHRNVQVLNRRHPNSGSQEVQAFLSSQNPAIIIPRERVRQALRRVDPVGTAARWAQVVHRRKYSVPGPNSLWHLDTHHSLRRWRIVVNGGIDGFSRLIVYLRACSENTARTTLRLFVNSVQRHGLPSRIRTDGGGEYVDVISFMEHELGTNRGTAITGSSVHNVRIERLWRDCFLKVLDKYYKLFYHMEDNGVLDIDNEIHMFCLLYVYLPRIDEELQEWLAAHNNHTVRTENHRTPNQLWVGGIIERIQATGTTTTPIRNILQYNLPGSSGNDDDDGWLRDLGVNWDLNDNHVVVGVPLTPNPLTPLQTESLLQEYPAERVLSISDSHGIDIFGNVVTFVLNLVVESDNPEDGDDTGVNGDNM